MQGLTLTDWLVVACYFALIAVIAIASSTAPPPDPERIRGLTYALVGSARVRPRWNRWDAITTGGVLACVLAMYPYFSFWI